MHEFESGFFAHTPAWHGLGTVLDHYPDSWAEARRLAGLDWEPVERPVLLGSPLTTEEILGGQPEAPTAIEGWKAITRSDTGELLHIHQNSYEVFPNAELGPLVEALLGEDDVQYETAGVLRGGRQVWVMLKLATPFEIPGDPAGATLSRLALQNSHDGSGALRAQRLQTRIVCANTSAAADRESGRHGMEYTFRHTKNMRDRIEDAKAALAGLRSDQEAYAEWARDLLGLKIDYAQRDEFLRRFIPEPSTDALISDRVRANIEKARDDFRQIYTSRTMPEEIRLTAYGLVQASVEWLDHARGARSQETRFNRTVLSPDGMKRQAERIAREVVNA